MNACLVKNIHPLIFLTFFLIVLGATFFYAPGWGLMDDYVIESGLEDFWKKGVSFESWSKLMKSDQGHGRFRPLYLLWAVSVYDFFSNNPTLIYVLIIVIGFFFLWVWGKVIENVFWWKERDFFTVFVFPLCFFIFTPFWNNFMYISVQEKFIFWFTAPALWYFVKSYENESITAFFFSLFWAVLAILGKESGIALILVFILYSLMDLCLFGENRKLSKIILVNTFLLLVGYYVYCVFFLDLFKGRYASLYVINFNPSGIVFNVLNASLAIRIILGLAILWIVIYGIAYFFKKTGRIKSQSVLFPLFVIAYLLVLSPFKFVNYLLAPLGPSVMTMFYPLYYFLSQKKLSWRWLSQGAVLGLSFLFLFGIIIPRISKMADKRKVVEFLSEYKNREPQAVFFYPQPFAETATLLGLFSGVHVNYLEDGILSREKIVNNPVSYLIMNDECMPVVLQGVVVERPIYQSKTWTIMSVNKKTNEETKRFAADFPRTFLERWKDVIKKL